eukprot:TRINITY_DN17593_c0_g1_i1.p1 TRINITY_DN17593_c0_g1~~TRINITY_DN17593_c0_g1_i1.p1  ORF type:complete len:267 (-),score=62.82 TRINITY_DN17593_c0_g1_i1:68-868(-)
MNKPSHSYPTISVDDRMRALLETPSHTRHNSHRRLTLETNTIDDFQHTEWNSHTYNHTHTYNHIHTHSYTPSSSRSLSPLSDDENATFQLTSSHASRKDAKIPSHAHQNRSQIHAKSNANLNSNSKIESHAKEKEKANANGNANSNVESKSSNTNLQKTQFVPRLNFLYLMQQSPNQQQKQTNQTTSHLSETTERQNRRVAPFFKALDAVQTVHGPLMNGSQLEDPSLLSVDVTRFDAVYSEIIDMLGWSFIMFITLSFPLYFATL